MSGLNEFCLSCDIDLNSKMFGVKFLRIMWESVATKWLRREGPTHMGR